MSGGVDEQAPPRTREPDSQAPDALGEHLDRVREDRWAWRRRIRSNPHQLRLYRCGVGALGLLAVVTAVVEARPRRTARPVPAVPEPQEAAPRGS